ncbi:MAG TPA: helix-turn-helix transcriptional regulator [Lachnospiraceae bacterium]|jgi:transcriptional regulator with XRE-family HTH domain|nr:helix-turn-helix transcriptional regulator [Lachnospiraceae bacterium]
MNIGEKIRARREALGMTQDELAHLMGYQYRSSVNKLENSKEVSLKRVRKAADALGCSPSSLLNLEQSSPTPSVNRKAEKIGLEIMANDDLMRLYTAGRSADTKDIAMAYTVLMALKRKDKKQP